MSTTRLLCVGSVVGVKLLALLSIQGSILFSQQIPPTITNVTNAAMPLLDNPPDKVSLSPRSMATIFGTNLADKVVSTTPPWKTTLGGTEVHLAGDTCFSASCDVATTLVYVSPTQINFVLPDATHLGYYRIVLIRNGQRIDDRSYMLGGPGYLEIGPWYADYDIVFHVGYDCLFSFSVSDPASCGLSWSQGQHRAPLGAITDTVSGQLISSKNPVHQGQMMTMWMTGFYVLKLNPKTGLLDGGPSGIEFGVAQLGVDFSSTVYPGMEGPYGTFVTSAPEWSGESPQYVGLDQVNVAFPTCTSKVSATVEKRYDAFLMYTNIRSGDTVRMYVPFLVRRGDPNCQW